MSTSIEVLEAEVLSLPTAERSRLLERLIASLDADPEIAEAWVREAERRDAEIDSGAVSLVPGEQVLARLRADLG
jgi:putative addiction module component (TIGR02574 family)